MKIGGWAPHELHQHEAEEVARDQAEGVRLAYVAATRARDLLVVPALGDEPWDGGWFAPLNAALYPARDARRQSTRGVNCPKFKSKDSVLQRPDDEPAGIGTVCPGTHAFADGYSVVWWEPGAGGGLQLGAKAPFGVRREELIVKDVPRHVIAHGRTHYDRWRLAREEARDAGKLPSASVATVGEWAAEMQSAVVSQAGGADKVRPTSGDEVRPASGLSDASLSDVAVLDLTPGGWKAGRSRGATFGTLVHAVLAQAPLDGSPEALRNVAVLEARILAMTDAEALDAATIAQRVFAHDIIGRARAAAGRHACRRETPITYAGADGRLIEGVVDLAFEEQGHWYVVDYKTDRDPLATDGLAYQRQVAVYCAAIASATGQPASGVLIRV
jgi:ATP-dependent exoDNAse (exonuclease V) beta subunit